MSGQFSLPLPRSEKQRWISAMCPSSPQEDKEVISEGEGSSLPPTTRATFPGLGAASRSPSPRRWAPCYPRGRQEEGSAWGGVGLRDPGGRAGSTCSQHAGEDAALPTPPCHPRRSPSYELENRFAEGKWLVRVQRSAAELGLELRLSVALHQLQRGQQQSGREGHGWRQAEGSALLIQRLLWA